MDVEYRIRRKRAGGYLITAHTDDGWIASAVHLSDERFEDETADHGCGWDTFVRLCRLDDPNVVHALELRYNAWKREMEQRAAPVAVHG